jgi:hypothetical protein
MFKKGDLVGLMIVNDWEEDKLSDSRGVVLRANGPESIALVYWTKGYQSVVDCCNLKLIAYGQHNV